MKTYFTITAGRTGTAWLGSFLSSNLGVEVIHEPLGVNDFGTKMPDIRTLRNFNTFGNNEFVRGFWKNKFNSLKGEIHAETNHTLAKCGLIENLVNSKLSNDSTIIILKRNIVKQCVSHLTRGDFRNITLAWQWYLHPSYPKIIINPKPFMELKGNGDDFGIALWYCYEMTARQEYYRQKYSDKLRFIDVSLEEITKLDGAQKFLKSLQLNNECILPHPKNANQVKPTVELVHQVKAFVNSVNFDVEVLVEDWISKGFSFDSV
jgi:hypothetical protein